jgi:hypothetical protein
MESIHLCGARVAGALQRGRWGNCPERSALGWELGRPLGWTCVPARRRPSHRVHTRAARGGAVVQKEEEGSTGRLPIGCHKPVRGKDGEGWRAISAARWAGGWRSRYDLVEGIKRLRGNRRTWAAEVKAQVRSRGFLQFSIFLKQGQEATITVREWTSGGESSSSSSCNESRKNFTTRFM